MNRRMTNRRIYTYSGFTILELIFVIGIIGILIGMLLPATRGVRGAARRTSCMNNARHIALAILNFESSVGHLPAIMGDEDLIERSAAQDNYRFSALVAIAPFMDFEAEFDQPLVHQGTEFPAMPSPTDPEYPLWQVKRTNLQCPSSVPGEGCFAETNYAFCVGDVAKEIHRPKAARGVMAARLNTKLDQIHDGASNTIMLSEINTGSDRWYNSRIAIEVPEQFLDRPSLVEQLLDPTNPKKFAFTVPLASASRGSNWVDGSANSGMFNTILRPNGPNVAIGGQELCDGYYSAGSYHPGGITVARADGSVTFINQDIDCGNQDQGNFVPSLMIEKHIPSPYGVWGALGTAAGEEPHDQER